MTSLPDPGSAGSFRPGGRLPLATVNVVVALPAVAVTVEE